MKKILSCLLLLAFLLHIACGFADGFRIPEGVKTIEEEAFAETAGLSEIILPQSTHSISSRAFANSGLKSIYIPQECYDIADDAFDGCNELLIIADRFNTVFEYAEKHGISSYVLSRENNFIEDPEYENGILSVSVTTDQEAVLVYSFGTDQTGEVFYEYSIPVDANVKNQRVTLDLPEGMPDYFELKACLYGEFRLSDEFRSIQFTSRYQRHESQTIESYKDNVTINFGGGSYAVLADGAEDWSRASQYIGDGVYRVTMPRAPENGKVYLVQDEKNEEVPILVKSFKDNRDGTYNVIEDQSASLSDLYNVYHLDVKCLNAPNTGGPMQINNPNMLDIGNPLQINDPSMEADLLKAEAKLQSDGCTIKVSGGIQYKVKMDYNKELFGPDYYDYSSKLTGSFKLSLETTKKIEKEKEVSLLHVPIYGIKGLGDAAVDIVIPWKLKMEAGMKATGTWKVEIGFTKNPTDGEQLIKKNEFEPDLEASAGFEATILAMKVECYAALPKDLLKVSVSAEIGIKLEGHLVDLKYSDSFGDKGLLDLESVHACQLCIDGVAKGYAKVQFSFTYNISKKLKGSLAEVTLLSPTIDLFKFYISVINDVDSLFEGKLTMGLGECPNYMRRTTVKTVDYFGTEMKGIPVVISKDDKVEDQGKSPFKTFLYPGDYTATASFDGGDTKEFFKITTKKKNLTIREGTYIISGRVTDDMIIDLPTPGAVLPVAGAEIKAFRNGKLLAKTTTDQGGNYLLELPGGDYRFELSAPHYRDKTVEYTVEGADGTFDIQMNGIYFSVCFYPRGVEDISTVTVYAVLEGNQVGPLPEPQPDDSEQEFLGWNTRPDGSGTEITSQTVVNENIVCYAVFEGSADAVPGTVTGYIRDKNRKGIYGARLTVLNAEGKDVTPATGSITNEDGTYTLELAPQGEYTILVDADPEFLPAERQIEIISDKKIYEHFTLYRKAETGCLSGTVQDAETGAVLAGIPFTVTKNAESGDVVMDVTPVSDELGHYEVWLPKGKYTVKAEGSRKYYAQIKKKLAVQEGETTVSDFALESRLKIGGRVNFGRFNQISSSPNGRKDDIEWKILDIQGNKAFLLSQRGLKRTKYHSKVCDITWEKADLRTWLNQDFYQDAFNADERACIYLTQVDNSSSQGDPKYETDGGNNTNDRIFLLSYAEVMKYFPTEGSRICYGTEAVTISILNVGTHGEVIWWLRSPGRFQSECMIVGRQGGIGGAGTGNMQYGDVIIRPALWVNLDWFNVP